MISERVQLDEDVSGPAAKAAAGVRELAASLREIGPEAVKAANATARLIKAQTDAAGGKAGIAAKARADAAEALAATRKQAEADKAAAKARADAERAAKKASARDDAAGKKSKAQAAARDVAAAEKEAANATRRSSAADEVAYRAAVKKAAGYDKAAKAARKNADAAWKQAKPRGGLGPALPRTLEASGGSIGTIASAINVSAIYAKAAELAARAAAAVVDMVKSGIVLAAEMASFKDETLDAMEASLGGAEAAEKAFAAGQKLAREIGGGPVERLKELRELLGKGFSETQAIDVIKGLADLKIRLPDVDAAGLSDALSKMANKGEFASRSLNALNEVGFASADIFAALGKRMGKTASEVEALMKAGKISGKEGIAAVLDLIKIKTGEANLGDIAKANANDLGELYNRLKAAPSDIFLAMEGGGSGNMQRALQGLVESLDPTTEAGKKLVKSFESVRDSADALFNDDNGAKAKLQQVAIAALTAAMEGFSQGLKDIKPIMDGAFAAMAALTGTDDTAAAMRGLGAAVAYAAVAFGGFVAIVLGPFIYTAKVVGDAIEGLRALAAPASSAGSSIGQGFVRGLLSALTGGISEIFFAGAQLAGAADAGARSPAGADAHSPSRKAIRTSQDIVAGYLLPLQGGAGPMAMAGAAMASASARATANGNAGGSAGSGGSAGGGVTIHVHLDSGATTAAMASPQAAQATGQQVGAAAHEAWVRRRREAA